MASMLKAALQAWSSGKKKKSDEDERKDASSSEDEDNEPMTQQQQQQYGNAVASPLMGKGHREEEKEEEEESSGLGQLETQRESGLIVQQPLGTIDSPAEPSRPRKQPPLSIEDETTTPQIHNNARTFSVVADEADLVAALAVPPLEMNLNRLRSMSRVFTALPPTLPSYRHMVMDQLEFLTHLLLLETSPTRLQQIQQDYLAALTHFCSLPQGREIWKAPGRLRSRSMLAAFALDLVLLQEDNSSTGVAQERMASPSTLTAADWDSLKEKLYQLRTILLQRNANRAPGNAASAASAAADPDPQLVQHAMMTVDFDHVVHLLEVQRALACFRANLCRIAEQGTSSPKSNRAVEQTVNDYVQTLERLFPVAKATTTGDNDKDDDDDDDDSDLFANDEDDDAIVTSDRSVLANVPKELHSFVLTDLYHPKQPVDPQQQLLQPQNEDMVDRLLEHVQSLIEDTATPTGTTPGPYSYAHLLATARSLWIKWSESVLEIPALVQLGYAGVISPIVHLRDHEDDVSSWGGDVAGAVGEETVEHASHHHHHPSRQRSRSSSSKHYPSHNSLPRIQSVTESETMESKKPPACNVVPSPQNHQPATQDQAMDLLEIRTANVSKAVAPMEAAGRKPPPRKEVAAQTTGIGAEEMAAMEMPPRPNEPPPPAIAAAPKQVVAERRPRGDLRERDATPPANRVDIATQSGTKQPQLALSKTSTKVAVNVWDDQHLYSSSDDEDRPLLRSQRDLSIVLPQLSLKRKREREPDLTDTDSVEGEAPPRRRKSSTSKDSHRRSSENSINQDSGRSKTLTSTNAPKSESPKKKKPRAVLWSSDSDDEPIKVKVARTKPPQRRRAFTDEETAAIVEGVRVFGVGRWAEIRQSDPCLKHRTNVQIKDKYRTIMKLAS